MAQHVAIPKTAGKVAFTWSEPDVSLLEDRRGELPTFPIDVFPPNMAKWLVRAARGAGTDIDHVALPLIGASSALIGKARRIQATPSWIEPMALWACIIGESGSRKTPGLRTVTRTMDRIEKDNRPLHISAAQKHQERVEWFKAEFKRWKKLCAAAIAEGNEPPAMPIDLVDPGAFIWPALYVSDCTAPRLARLCNVRPRGMLQIRDELAALFSSMKAAGSRALYLEAWVGERFVFERVDDRKSFVVEHLLVGLVGGFQPDKLARVFAGDEDGFYGRFLFGWPLAPSYAPLSSDIGEVDPDFQAVLQKLIWLPAEDENNEFAPRIVPISDDARAVFENYRKFVDRTKRSVEGRELQWLAKSETHVLRLAGTLSYLSWASMTSRSGLESITGGLEPTEISARSMDDATRLMRDYFWPHARAALRQIGISDRHRHIRRVLRWLRANTDKRTEISLRDIRRDALAHAVDVDQAHDLVDRMVGAGWLQFAGKAPTGGRPRERWLVNPLLFAGDEEPTTTTPSATKAKTKG